MARSSHKLPLWTLKLAVKLSGRPTGVSDELKQFIADHGCIFIHIPKCAGMAVQKSLFGDTYFGHQTIRQYEVALPADLYRKAWKFAVTRCPWERLVSAWLFLKAGGYHIHVDEVFFEKNLSQYSTFDHFVNDWLVYQDPDRCGCVHFKSQLHYLCNFKGQIAVDYLVKLTDLQVKYSYLKDIVGGGELIVYNQNQVLCNDHMSYYTSNETFNNVAELYKEDVRQLGYTNRLGASL
jgi:hypothetical protein